MYELSSVINDVYTLYPKIGRKIINPEEIEKYLSKLSFKLPKELHKLYFFTNGFDENIQFFGLGEFLTLEKAIVVSENIIKEIKYQKNWFPIMKLEESLLVVEGSSQQKLAKVYRFFLDDLENRIDYQPKIIFHSLTELLVEHIRSYLSVRDLYDFDNLRQKYIDL